MFNYLNTYEIDSRKVEPKYIKVKLNPKNVDEDTESNIVEIGKEIILNEKNLGNTSLLISSIELKKEFVNYYNFCVEKNDCYSSIEYIKPNLNTNYDKVLLKITGNLVIDQEKSVDFIKNIFHIVKYFGKIAYTKQGEGYEITNFTKVEPKKYKDENQIFIELNETILDADEAYLIIQLRNKVYKYE